MNRWVLAAVCLAGSVSARAQMEARTAVVLPPAAGSFVLAPSAVVPALAPGLAPMAAPAFAASPLAAPSAPAPAPAPSAAPAAAAAAMSGALAEFGKTDLKSASAADARGAGEDLMLRALGAAPVEAAPVEAAPAVLGIDAPPPASLPAPSSGGSAPRPQPRMYLLSKPLRETVRLGPVSIALHAVGAVLWELTKAAVAYKATGSFAAAATVFAFESTTSPVMMTARSLGDLGFRYWRRKLGVLKELAKTPGVARVKVLTTGDVSFWGPFARGKDNTGLIFVEAFDQLPEAMGRFGAPIPLGDVAASRVRLQFVQGGAASEVSWTPTLKELLDGKPIPPETAAAWRAEAGGGKPNLVKMIDVTGAKGKARLEATLVGADGAERGIGAISEGPAARALIGLGWLDRARAFLGRARPARAIPISDSLVERRGDARETGFGAALKRAWRRLSGRLIVVR